MCITIFIYIFYFMRKSFYFFTLNATERKVRYNVHYRTVVDFLKIEILRKIEDSKIGDKFV